MGKKKIVLDTNILISAFGWEGKPRTLLKKALDEEFELITSTQQIAELKTVLDYPKFSFTEDQKRTMLSLIQEGATVIELHMIVNIVPEDPDDNIIVTTAIEANADHIITGDEHILKLKNVGAITILTATECLEILQKT